MFLFAVASHHEVTLLFLTITFSSLTGGVSSLHSSDESGQVSSLDALITAEIEGESQ